MYVPQLALTITPQFSARNGDVGSLDIRLEVEQPRAAKDAVFFEQILRIGNIETPVYSQRTLHLEDEDGALAFRTDDKDGKRVFTLERPTRGNVTATFTAPPRDVDRNTPPGPRHDLRRDQGGLIGAGVYFLPKLVAKQDEAARYRIMVRWVLDGAPSSARAVWTFGEGISPPERVGTADDLVSTIYMVGPIQGIEENTMTAGPEQHDKSFGCYWFGSPPPNISSQNASSRRAFEAMSDFFRDPPSTDNPYRIFVRRGDPARTFGGSGFVRSYVLEYDSSSIKTISDDVITLLIAHEIVHNFPLIGSLSDTSDDKDAWYNEGIADYYSVELPHRYSLLDEPTRLVHWNDELTSYYTNPCVAWSNDEAADKAWQNWSAQMLPYSRGSVYLLKANAQIRAASAGARSLDDAVVLPLLRRKETGRPASRAEYLALLRDQLGERGLREFDDMLAGRLLELPADALGERYRILRRDREVLEVGWVKEAGRVKGLKAGSRAEKAGLREGDEVVSNSFFWLSAQKFDLDMIVVVKRDGKEETIKYWPRGWHKVPCWRVQGR